MQRIRTLRTTTLGALVLGAFVLLIGPAAAHAKGKGQSTIDGTLSSVSVATRTLTVQSRGGQQTMLKLDASSRLVRNGKRAALADLVLRDRITARFDRATLRLTTAQARGPQLETTRGRLAGWDGASRLLDVQTRGGEKTFRVDGATLLLRNGQAARPADLRSGDALTVHSRGGQPALAKDVQAEGDDDAEVEGEITAIAGGDVTIDPEPGDPVTVHVDDTTEIQIESHGVKTDATLADLEVGQDVEAEYDPATMVASEIEIEQEEEDEAEVEGTLAAVDAAAGTFSITPEGGGADVALTADTDTKITLDGEPATLADLAVGSEAEAKYDPATMLASRLEVKTEDEEEDEAEVEGTLAAVDAAAGTFSITPEGGGADVALTADADTKITLDGEPATLADLAVGSEAEAKYDPATMLASRLEVETEDDDNEDD